MLRPRGTRRFAVPRCTSSGPSTIAIPPPWFSDHDRLGGVNLVGSGVLRSWQINLTSSGFVLQSNNGLAFGAKVFANVAHRYALTQEYITSYTPP